MHGADLERVQVPLVDFRVVFVGQAREAGGAAPERSGTRPRPRTSARVCVVESVRVKGKAACRSPARSLPGMRGVFCLLRRGSTQASAAPIVG